MPLLLRLRPRWLFFVIVAVVVELHQNIKWRNFSVATCRLRRPFWRPQLSSFWVRILPSHLHPIPSPLARLPPCRGGGIIKPQQRHLIRNFSSVVCRGRIFHFHFQKGGVEKKRPKTGSKNIYSSPKIWIFAKSHFGDTFGSKHGIYPAECLRRRKADMMGTTSSVFDHHRRWGRGGGEERGLS